MDRILRQEISRRIGERKRALEDAETMHAHIEAIAEVFEVDVAEVEAIMAEVQSEGLRDTAVASRGAETLRRFQMLVGLVVAALIVAGALVALGPLRDHFLGPASEPTANARPYVQASRLAGLLAAIVPLRMMVMEYQMIEGAYPSRLEDLGLRREDMRTGQYVQDLTLGPDGAILVKADASLGEGFYLMLSPRETMGGLNTEWRCVTSVAVRVQSTCEVGDLSDAASMF